MLNRMSSVKIKRGKKRLGRGYGSGKGGHTVGRGAKGQKARNSVPVGFEGGQIPLYKRLPQIGGFKSTSRIDVTAIPLDRLNSFKDGSEVTPKDLELTGVVKLLAGKLEKKLTLKGFKASKGAIKAIEKSGSTLSE